ncbi:hypothetical protein L6164_025908 [Bauhinia variegata]|uniref:Uncharacterized protein n=1 Tax=Bauhinia variegata TaxID=167791 RepID=A0ACB9M245_BAUVA|nr:hypothetical protein L6164_025908 [Bauhinia variegata]
MRYVDACELLLELEIEESARRNRRKAKIQYGGNPFENLNLHIANFLQLFDTIKMQGASEYAIRLRLFPFSLGDKVCSWLQSQPQESITIWLDLVINLFEKFFPPQKLAKLRSEITSFAQQDMESPYKAWERYKGFLRYCPYHAILNWLQIHTFYSGLNLSTKTSVDAAAKGFLNTKNAEEAT